MVHSSMPIIVAKTTSGFNSDRTTRQYAHGLLLSPFVPSSTDRWAVRAKIRQNGRLIGRKGETGSRNGDDPKSQLSDPGFLFAPSDSF